MASTEMQIDLEIDDSLYSRQRYVLGDTAMHKMAQSNVFISGLGGLGIEIAKNVILAGVKSVTVHDVQCAVVRDLGSQFFLRQEDVDASKNRAEACHQRLADLNPYVDVSIATFPLDTTTDLSFLTSYQCVVMNDVTNIELLSKIDVFCRTQSNPIKFIVGCVKGISCYGFCDFGENFIVFDKNGEEPTDFFISDITQSNPAILTCLPNERHGLEDGDSITISELQGMNDVIREGEIYQISVINPNKFSINVDTTVSTSLYKNGGRVKQIKTPITVNFRSLAEELNCPTYQIVDFAKMERPPHLLLFFLALDKFLQSSGSDNYNAATDDNIFKLCQFAKEINQSLNLVDNIDESLLKGLAITAAGYLPPLATILGGILGQEVLISITGKFSPLKQWVFIDVTELLYKGLPQTANSMADRYSSLRMCIGDEAFEKLASLKLFMVGCGAIGCEMLKSYAMLGIGQSNKGGHIVITDNDIIEKSNLNRQFLFRSQHIQQHKSVVAAHSTKDINPDLSIEAQRYKVFPGTEEKIYNDSFFQNLDIVINALDNVEARRYIDSRCVTNNKPLMESGTLGTKGHVQVILPEMTESYSSQQDPPEKDVPYCTLKSFPANIEHTIQWARDKFETLWSQKPVMYNKFWKTHTSPTALLKSIETTPPDGSLQAVKLLYNRPTKWIDCVHCARIKFEKYFNHKALNLINAFPLDTKLPDGSLFWASPKRPPTPLQFSPHDQTHILFVTSYARLLADIHSITYTQEDLTVDSVIKLVSTAVLPQHVPSSKRIETDESVKGPQSTDPPSVDKIDTCIQTLKELSSSQHTTTIPSEYYNMCPLSFEKDDDSNGHIDFITAASNLRAIMYNIDTADRYKTKLIAGRIVPAIATTTAAVAGLVSLELIKVVLSLPLDHYKNAFMNLALPELPLILSEPAPCKRNTIRDDICYTLWTRWEVRGSPEMTLKQFIETIKLQYKVETAMIVLGVKMIYVPIIPGHRKRLTQTMVSLIKPQKGTLYVDLTLSFEDDKAGPPVRYYF